MSKRRFDREGPLIEQGAQAFAAGDYPTAIKIWTRIIAMDPTHEVKTKLAEAHFRHALTLYSSHGHLNAIISDLSVAARHEPNWPLYWYHLGLAYGRAGIPSKALSSLRKAVALDPNSERFLYHQAVFALETNPGETLKILMNQAGSADPWKYLEVLFDLRQQQPDLAYHSAQDIADEKGEVIFLKGIAAQMQERYDLSRQLLYMALGKNPTNPAMAYYLGFSCYKENDIETATRLWEAAYAAGLRTPGIESALVAAYYNQALGHALNHRLDDLIACLQSILRLPTESGAEIRPMLALSYFLKGNKMLEVDSVSAAIPFWQQALTGYEDLLRSASTQMDQEDNQRHYLNQTHKLYHNLALAYDLTEKVDLAIMNWERLIKTWRNRYKSGNPEVNRELIVAAYRHLADDYQKIGRIKDALAAYGMALKHSPDLLEVHEELGELYLAGQEWPRAAHHWSEVVRIKGDGTDAYTKLGMALQRDGQPERALECWQRALELEPKNRAAKNEIFRSREPEILRNIERGRYDHALEILEELLAILPDLPIVRIMMSDAYWGKGRRSHAMDQIERAIAINPRDPTIWIEVIQSLLFNKRSKELIAIVDGAESQFADDYVFYISLGHAYLDFDRDRKAVAYYDKALEVARRKREGDPTLPEVLAQIALEIAWKWVDLSEFGKARKFFKVGIEAQPNKANLHYFLGCALAEDRLLAEAEQSWSLAESLAQAQSDEKLIYQIRAARASFSEMREGPRDLEELMRLMKLLKYRDRT
ncbi:MAG: tetratricopeptide repeat protein [Acidobacteria bacterium]|nr:tetratricopeptide repeat protein [Acidobacteriota bacterium]MBI3657381.1 tetratricopeptide repeat protein [Acidobacteriota bacterium]